MRVSVTDGTNETIRTVRFLAVRTRARPPGDDGGHSLETCRRRPPMFDDAMTRTVVTGAAGFVGRWLVKALAERGDEVSASDRIDPADLPPEARFVLADIRSGADVVSLCEGAEVVFHTASVIHTRHDGSDTLRAVNVEGTRHLLEAAAAAGVKRFVYVSSASVVYEGRDIENGDERLPYAKSLHSPYAKSKAEAEAMVLAASKDSLRTVAIRPHIVFGPGDTRFLPAILERARAGRLKVGVGRRRSLSDFTYISNLTDALLLADAALQGDSPTAAGQAYFVSNGEPIDFFDFVNRVLEGLDLPAVRARVPFALAYGAAAVAETWQTWRGAPIGQEEGLSRFSVRYMCTHHFFSIEKARRDLGYAPRVDLAGGIELTCEALRRAGSA